MYGGMKFGMLVFICWKLFLLALHELVLYMDMMWYMTSSNCTIFKNVLNDIHFQTAPSLKIY